MALIKSTILSVISGSVNGTTFSRNYTGAYARNRTVPVNQNTTAQQNARAYLAAATIEWGLLTEAQREAWRVYAAATPVVNRVGDTVYLKGSNHYVAAAAFRLTVGSTLAAAATAPTTPGVAPALVFDPTTTSLVAATDDIDAGFTAPATAPQFLLLSVGLPISAGRQFYNGPWNSVVADLVAPGWPQAFGTSPINLVAGVRYAIRARYITSTNKLSPAAIAPSVLAT